MFRTPILNQNDLFLDIDGKPLVRGKIDILDPVSNNPITVWTYSDDEYTVTANPVILDIEGRTEQTIFSDRISYCRLYSYHGLDENNHPIYVFVRDWFCGQNDTSESKEYITGMADLKDVDPSVNSSINVLGYHNAYDCELRSYVWDSGCQQDEDGGYIVASDVDENGRWVLSFDGEYLPSTYYGVYPGQEANINALLGYVGTVGSNSIKTAPGVYFKPGNYQTATNLATTKKVLLDANTSFASTYLDCSEMRVLGTPTSAITDIFTTEGEVHSSWFKNIKNFFNNSAPVKVLDGSNATNTVIDNVYTVTGTLKGSGRVSMTFGTGAKLIFNCVIDAKKFVSPSDKVRFMNQHWSDEWWTATNPAQFDFVNNTEYRTMYFDDMNISRFGNKRLWAMAMKANGATSLDFEGSTISTYDFTGITHVSNVTITGTATFDITSNNLQLTNVTANSVTTTGTVYGMWMNDCNITLTNQFTGSFLNLDGSRLYSTIVKPINCSITSVTAVDSEIYCNIGQNDYTGSWNVSNYAKTKAISMYNTLMEGSVSCNGNCAFSDCRMSKQVDCYPYIENTTAYVNFAFDRCIFVGTFKINVDYKNWVYDTTNVPRVVLSCLLDNNDWRQGGDPMYMPFYSEVNNRVSFIASSGHSFSYKGNTGNCLPEMFESGMLESSFNVSVTITGLSDVYRQSTAKSLMFINTNWWNLTGGNDADITSKYKVAMMNSNDGEVDMQKELIVVNKSYIDPNVNDMFQWYATIANGNPGDTSHSIIIFRMA